MDEFDGYHLYSHPADDDDYEPLDGLSEWGWVCYSLIAGASLIGIVTLAVYGLLALI